MLCSFPFSLGSFRGCCLLLILVSHMQMFHAQPKPGEGAMAPQPPAPRPKVRARRGQATDPHSIAERVIADKLTISSKIVVI